MNIFYAEKMKQKVTMFKQYPLLFATVASGRVSDNQQATFYRLEPSFLGQIIVSLVLVAKVTDHTSMFDVVVAQ